MAKTKETKINPYPYDSFSSIQTVVQNYENSVINYGWKNEDIKQLFLTELNDLKTLLTQQENYFYTSLGLPPNPASLKQIKANIEVFENSGAKKLLDLDISNRIIEKISEIIGFDEKTTNQILTNLEEVLNSNDAINSLLSEDSPISEILNKALNTEKGKGRFDSSTKKGINTQLKYTRDASKKIKIEINGTFKFSMQGKIALLLNDLNEDNKEKQITIPKAIFDKGLLQQLWDEVLSPNISGAPAEYVKYEILNEGRAKLYNKAFNKFVIQGWLGEVYWNACLSYLTGKLGQTMPTGNIKNIKGKSLSVDILAGMAGFQVKVWSVKNGLHTTENSMSLSNFLQNRALLLDQAIGKVIVDLFGSVSYYRTKDFSQKESDDNDQLKGEFDQSYWQKAVSYTQSYQQLQDLFQTRIQHIISIDVGGITTDALLGGFEGEGGERKFYNTFWLINDNIYPSSLIIQQLIDQLNGLNTNDLINFQLNSMNDKGGKGYYSPIENDSELKMGNRWNIDYSVIFNINNLMNAVEKLQ